ncbi:hypothetical protein AB0E69_08385 [Kribbella sp. NPDC026611]|uniref:hypothetical protein n=1 Tax=Kribbella sp. NPDC026611 TaxID=3154911 RepID=UPI003402CAC5
MRLNELLGHRVHDRDGNDIGGVADVRLVQEAPGVLRVDGLILVENRATRLFGYERHVGPALLRRLVHSRLGEVWFLPWSDVDRITDGHVMIRSSRSDLKRLEEMARY